MHPSQIQKDLILTIESALKRISGALRKKLPLPLKIELNAPKDPGHGDLSASIAMRLSKAFSAPGVTLANRIKDELTGRITKGRLRNVILKMEVFPPGFINFWFTDDYLHSVLSLVCKEGEAFGKSSAGKNSRVNIEFVSANPTGPLTVAHGRQAAVGDVLSRILEFSGHKVTREYLINDVGTQIELLGKSIHARYLTLNNIATDFPQDGYQGDYIKDIAEALNKQYGKKFLKSSPKTLESISGFGVNFILKTIKSDLKAFGIFFDKWFSQRKLSPAAIKKGLRRLKNKGYIYEKDGATWFKSTAFGDEKDRVVIKNNGAFTYLAPDIAYHLNKYGRKFNKLIDIWGPDHHGYIPRLRASVEALGYKRDSISILIVQLARLLRNGVLLSMSTRKGEFLTLKEVMDEVGRDVTKFFFLMRKLDSHLEFDLEVAKKNSLDNPVYYIQYAHARIASILGFSGKLEKSLQSTPYDPKLLTQPEERGLIITLYRFPLVIEASARTLEPYKLVEFLNGLAKDFHSFYTKHRVVSEDDLGLTKARLTMVEGIKTVLASGLNLLGLSFPDRM